MIARRRGNYSSITASLSNSCPRYSQGLQVVSGGLQLGIYSLVRAERYLGSSGDLNTLEAVGFVHFYTCLQTFVVLETVIVLISNMALPGWRSLIEGVRTGASLIHMSYVTVPRPPLAGTCYVPAPCLIPQPPEVYYQPPPQAATYQPPAQTYLYQPPPVPYSVLPPAQVYYYQSPMVRVQ